MEIYRLVTVTHCRPILTNIGNNSNTKYSWYIHPPVPTHCPHPSPFTLYIPPPISFSSGPLLISSSFPQHPLQPQKHTIFSLSVLPSASPPPSSHSLSPQHYFYVMRNLPFFRNMHGQNLNSLLKQKGKVCQIADIKNPDNIVSKDNLRTLTLSFILFGEKNKNKT